jgi:hypothetical protein
MIVCGSICGEEQVPSLWIAAEIESSKPMVAGLSLICGFAARQA